MTRLALAACACAALMPLAGPARAQPPGPPNRPGGLFIAPDGEPFRGPGGLAAWFEGADTDHDGALTLAEFRADAMRFFKVLDANGDGLIDGFENTAYETKIAPEILRTGLDEDDDRRGRAPEGGPSEHGSPRGGGPPGGAPPAGAGGMRGGEDGPRPFHHGRGPGGERREGAARFSLLNEPQPVRGADADLDWKVTAEEWARAAARRFALLDTDNDGRLTLATLPPVGGRAGPPRGR